MKARLQRWRCGLQRLRESLELLLRMACVAGF